MTVVNSLTEETIELIAENLRKLLNLNDQLFFPIVKFAEQIIYKADNSYNFRIGFESDPDLKDAYAYYNSEKNEMVVRQDIYDRALEGDGPSRFTIAHEVGHYILHRKGICMYRFSENAEIDESRDPEWQANTFAGALLIPNKLIGDMDKFEVAKACETSIQAAEISCNKSKKAKHFA